MLHIGYLIILDGQSMKKVSFGNFALLSNRGRKAAEASCALDPSGAPPQETQIP